MDGRGALRCGRHLLHRIERLDPLLQLPERRVDPIIIVLRLGVDRIRRVFAGGAADGDRDARSDGGEAVNDGAAGWMLDPADMRRHRVTTSGALKQHNK